jgi:hypothetical protein
MLMHCELSEPAALFEAHPQNIGEDYIYPFGENGITEAIRYKVLEEIETILFRNGMSLSNFASTPQGIELPPTFEEHERLSRDVVDQIIQAESQSSLLNEHIKAVFGAVWRAAETMETEDHRYKTKRFSSMA